MAAVPLAKLKPLTSTNFTGVFPVPAATVIEVVGAVSKANVVMVAGIVGSVSVMPVRTTFVFVVTV